MKQDIFSTPHGPVVLQWFEAMTSDECSEFCEWLHLVELKIKRIIEQQKEKP